MAPRRAAKARLPTRVLVAVLMLGPAFAGCGDKGFLADVPLWHSGFGWEYDETLVETTTVTGTPPGALESEETGAEVIQTNSTHRLEVFNSTAASVEGIPIYALAVLNRIYPDDNETPVEDIWDAWVYSADLNLVQPTYLDWRNQEIQLSGDGGGVTDAGGAGDGGDGGGLDLLPSFLSLQEEEAASGGQPDFNRPENEFRRLDWPLTKDHAWRHEEIIPMLELEGVFEGYALRQFTARVPAGNFTAIEIDGRLTANDLSEFEDDIRQGLESEGGDVDRLDVSYQSDYEYGYSSQVLNFVTFEQVDTFSVSAAGEAGGERYDFTFTRERITSRVLVKYQLEEGVEKPLTFALDVMRGAYAPKPITPASHLAVEILVAREGLNMLSDDTAYIGMRIYNSTAGEKKIRSSDASFPAVQRPEQFAPKYDHEFLEVFWTVSDLLPSPEGEQFTNEVVNETTDQLSLRGSMLQRPGLKLVTATLKLKDFEGETGQYIYTDSVYFEVYTQGNFTGTLNATDQPGPIQVQFPVEHTATRLTIFGSVVGAPAPEAQCPLFFGNDCIRARDAQNRGVPDDRQEVMRFESTRLGQFVKGTWKAEFTPAYPSESVVFEITVRYRPGV